MINAMMLVRLKEALADERLCRIAYATADAFGHRRFAPGGCIKRVGVYSHQGPAIKQEDGETLLSVGLNMQYYDHGYEEGDLPVILAIADFILTHLPASEIWYGGDAAGYAVRPLTASRRESLIRSFTRLDRHDTNEADVSPAPEAPRDSVYAMPMRVVWRKKLSVEFASRATGEIRRYENGEWVTP